MNDLSYPLATSSWGPEEIRAAIDVINSGQYTMGERVRTYEKDFANFLGVKHCVMVNSGSSANLLMVAALFFRKSARLKAGDVVIVPAVSWPTTYYPLSQYGLRLRFVDVDLESLNYDLKALEQSICPETRLVMCVNLLGNPNEFEQIKQIIGSRDVTLVEDNCESLGARFQGRQAGTFGAMGTYSSFFSHHISTMEGGIISTDDDELYHLLLCLRAHGWTRNLPKFNHIVGEKSDDEFVESFRFVLPGYNVRPLEIEAAIGIEQIRKLAGFIRIRRDNAAYFTEKFKNQKTFIVQKEIGESSWFGFSFVIRPDCGLRRERVVSALRESRVECRPIVAGNFAKNEVLKWMDSETPLPLRNAEWIDANGLFVGNQEVDRRVQIDLLHRALSPFF